MKTRTFELAEFAAGALRHERGHRRSAARVAAESAMCRPYQDKLAEREAAISTACRRQRHGVSVVVNPSLPVVYAATLSDR